MEGNCILGTAVKHLRRSYEMINGWVAEEVFEIELIVKLRTTSYTYLSRVNFYYYILSFFKSGSIKLMEDCFARYIRTMGK